MQFDKSFLYYDILRLCNFYWMLIMCKGKRLKNKRQCQIQDFNFSIHISSTLHQISFSSPISCLKSFLIQILSLHSSEKLFWYFYFPCKVYKLCHFFEYHKDMHDEYVISSKCDYLCRNSFIFDLSMQKFYLTTSNFVRYNWLKFIRFVVFEERFLGINAWVTFTKYCRLT